MFIVSYYLQSSLAKICLHRAEQLPKSLRVFSLSLSLHESVEFCLNPVYRAIVGENFQMFDVQITGKCIWESRNLNILTCVWQQISPQGSYHQPSDKEKLPIPSQTTFFMSTCPPAESGGKETTILEKTQ